MVLPREFYARDSAIVARELLGKKLVRRLDDILLTSLITDVEAYYGAQDSASHAFKGETPRNSVMFGPAGFSYVYFVYGKHYMFNIVTQKEGQPAAVLVRAVHPLTGLKRMQQLRKGNEKHIADGPARLCQALNIDKKLNHLDLTQNRQLWLEPGAQIKKMQIKHSPRIGIPYAEKQHRHALLRFWLSQDVVQRIRPLEEYVCGIRQTCYL
jgi:DNA-3-methyladenine glycosylase